MFFDWLAKNAGTILAAAIGAVITLIAKPVAIMIAQWRIRKLLLKDYLNSTSELRKERAFDELTASASVGAPAREAASYLHSLGIINKVIAHHLSDPVTKEQFTNTLIRAIGRENLARAFDSYELPFVDVEPGKSGSIYLAVQIGLFPAENNEFHPQGLITHVESIMACCKALGYSSQSIADALILAEDIKLAPFPIMPNLPIVWAEACQLLWAMLSRPVLPESRISLVEQVWSKRWEPLNNLSNDRLVEYLAEVRDMREYNLDQAYSVEVVHTGSFRSRSVGRLLNRKAAAGWELHMNFDTTDGKNKVLIFRKQGMFR